VTQATASSPGSVAADAKAWWAAFWARSAIALPQSPMIEAFWYGSQYATAAMTASTEMLAQTNGKKTGFFGHLYIKCIILPRQARDKHRESTQKRARFLAGLLPPPGLYGPWVTTDSPGWNGDYTLDYNQVRSSSSTHELS
jgi:hypothetical protein